MNKIDEEVFTIRRQLELDKMLAGTFSSYSTSSNTGYEMRESPLMNSGHWTAALRQSHNSNKQKSHTHSLQPTPFETRKLLQSLQSTTMNRCSKSKLKQPQRFTAVPITTHAVKSFKLRPSKLARLKTTHTQELPNLASMCSLRVRRNGALFLHREGLLERIPEEHHYNNNNNNNEDGIYANFESSSSTLFPAETLPQQSCSQQATNTDLNINELASYFDLYLHLPKKMSPMAERMYT